MLFAYLQNVRQFRMLTRLNFVLPVTACSRCTFLLDTQKAGMLEAKRTICLHAELEH